MTTLLDLTLKVSSVVLLALVATGCMRRRSAAARHSVLAAALGCAAALPLMTLIAPPWHVDVWPAWTRSLEGSTSAAFRPASPRVERSSPDEPPRVAVSAEAAAGGTSERTPVAGPIVLLWLLGIAANAGFVLAGGFRLRRVQSLSEPVPGHAWRRVAEEVARRYGLRRAPLLLQSRHPSLLVTWGVLRPAVILPAAAHAWNEERIRIVLGHELAHIRRNDWLLQVAAELVRCVYWFNPIVWSGFRRMRQESEQACDDEVLKLGIDGRTYAAHLLDIARTFRTQAIAWAPASAIARPSSLERRVRAMLNDRVNRNRVTPLASAVVVGVVMGIAIPIAGFDALAQTRFATISGTAADESGAVLVDIAVSLVNVGTKAKYEVRTNQAGAFEFVGLPAGDYMFEGRTLGFEPFREAVTVGVGDSLQRNIALRIGAVQETITVVAGADDPASAASGDRVVTARAPRRRPCPNPAVGGCIGPPVKVKDVRPVYPQALRNASLPGTVVIEGQIGTDGRMKDMRVVSSPHPAFEEAALEAVAAWEFTPTTLNGRVTDTRIRVSVSFSPSVAP